MENTENTGDLIVYVSVITVGGGLRGWTIFSVLYLETKEAKFKAIENKSH